MDLALSSIKINSNEIAFKRGSTSGEIMLSAIHSPPSWGRFPFRICVLYAVKSIELTSIQLSSTLLVHHALE